MSQAVFNLKSVYFLSTSFSNSGYSKPFFVVYWYAYLHNDPVNCVDLWGLTASDKENPTGFKGLLNSAIDFIKQHVEVNVRISVGLGLSANISGLELGADLGSMNANFRLKAATAKL